MTTWQKYILAHSIDEALHFLSNAQGSACPIGGGTDLLLEIQQGHHDPVHTLVDVTRIPELQALELRGDVLFIGAGVPVHLITESLLVRFHALAVSEACGLIGGPQVRNTATLGGNVAHALPAADGMISLFAFDAMVEIISINGPRMSPIGSLFKGPGKSTLIPNQEFIIGFHLPTRKPGQASSFSRVMRPQGVALPILNMAVWLERMDQQIKNIQIAIGPSGPVPVRATAVEELLRGKVLNSNQLTQAKQAIHDSIRFRTSAMRATADYRHHLSEVLLEEVIGKAWQRATELEVVV
jgi:xanthine dehydrogenase FAD-binding subunit